jgi:two-component system, OmpR family, response regulator
MERALHILHVDDDEEIRQIVAMSLGLRPGIEVIGAGDAEQALGIAADRSRERPDIALLDYSIGIDDGVALLAALRRIPGLEALPVVFLTGRLREKEREAMLAAGARGVLRKPFNPLTLAEELRALLPHQ